MKKNQWNKWVHDVPEITHGVLVSRGFQYLKYGVGCSVVFKERSASVSETPDVLGFRYGKCSYLIECKASRSDFLEDKKKWFRRYPQSGMGLERYFMTPIGMLTPDELPEGWGLIEVYPKERGSRRIRVAKDSKQFEERSVINELSYVLSAIRRIEISLAVFVEAPKESEC